MRSCWVCQVEDYLNVYEYKLFDTTRRLAEGEMDHGYRGESAQEIVLKSILSFSKSKIALPEMIAATQSRLSLLEELKKEFPVGLKLMNLSIVHFYVFVMVWF